MNSQKIRVHPSKFSSSVKISKRNLGEQELRLRRVNVFISGKVQGVFFRQFIQEKAQELGLFGWVRNLSDGRVEASIEGDKEKIDKILTYLEQGSPLSKIKNIEINYEKYQGKFKDFSISLC